MNQGITMTKYIVYQVRNDVDRDTRLSLTCDYYDDGWMGRVTEAIKGEKAVYEKAMQINAADLDEVFEIGNFMHPDFAPRALKQFPSSVSVGDIVHDTEVGRVFVVAPHGFNELILD